MVLFIPCLSWPVCIVLLLVAYLVYLCWYYRTFSRQGIRCHATPVPFLGTIPHIMKKGFYLAYDDMLEEFGETFGGYSTRHPCLTTIDFEILRDVFVKDMETFPTRSRLVTGDPLHDNMLNNIVDYGQWKRIRSLMSRTFSSSKLKRMMPLINACAKRSAEHLHQPTTEGKSVDMKEYAGFFTMDVIAVTGFGIDLDSQQDENNDFVKYAKMAMDVSFKHPLFIILFFFPLLVGFLPYMGIKVMKKEMTDFFTGVTKQVMEGRKEDRGDFLSLMMNAHNEPGEEGATPKLTEEELISNSLLFFIAGYDTTASSAAFLAHSLMANPDVQEKLYEEIEAVIGERDQVSDEDLHNMPYLDKCVNETLRMYPAAGITERTANKDVVLKGIHLPATSVVRVPIHAMHHYAKIYPEPEKFDPERFSPEEKAKRNPLSFMPFGAGPRQCIATRLALMEMKVYIIHLLRTYRLLRGPETEIPVVIDPQMGLLKAKNGVWLKLEERHHQ